MGLHEHREVKPRKKRPIVRIALLIVQVFVSLIALAEGFGILFALVRFGTIVWLHIPVFLVAAVVAVITSRLRQRLAP